MSIFPRPSKPFSFNAAYTLQLRPAYTIRFAYTRSKRRAYTKGSMAYARCASPSANNSLGLCVHRPRYPKRVAHPFSLIKTQPPNRDSIGQCQLL
ncbi:MAG: hypothetical protein IPK82_17615 [Polyangiaceae bacterium]|nr:hypothetical protein [Polyangiaceae bacterium]